MSNLAIALWTVGLIAVVVVLRSAIIQVVRFGRERTREKAIAAGYRWYSITTDLPARSELVPQKRTTDRSFMNPALPVLPPPYVAPGSVPPGWRRELVLEKGVVKKQQELRKALHGCGAVCTVSRLKASSDRLRNMPIDFFTVDRRGVVTPIRHPAGLLLSNADELGKLEVAALVRPEAVEHVQMLPHVFRVEELAQESAESPASE